MTEVRLDYESEMIIVTVSYKEIRSEIAADKMEVKVTSTTSI